MTDCCSSKQQSLYSISTTPGNPGNLREFEIAPGILEISWNFVDAPGKFYN